MKKITTFFSQGVIICILLSLVTVYSYSNWKNSINKVITLRLQLTTKKIDGGVLMAVFENPQRNLSLWVGDKEEFDSFYPVISKLQLHRYYTITFKLYGYTPSINYLYGKFIKIR